jgi:DNA (cytosine-5)-methyltransferase 1
MTTSETDVDFKMDDAAGRHSVHRFVGHSLWRHLDLFSGIGGFALACRMVGGIETIGFSEIDTYANSILKRHWPSVPNYGDIRNVRGIQCDIITGGFPCQPFSSLGNRAGKDDNRYLWPEMLRVISESGCRWVCAENVPRIIGVALDDVFDDLEREGFAAWAANIPACAVSAPHYRPRVWVVAHRESRGVNGMVGERPISQGANESGRGHTNRGFDGTHAASAKAGWPAWNGGARVRRVADGVSSRIHALGNAIVPQVAAEIIAAMKRVDYLANRD